MAPGGGETILRSTGFFGPGPRVFRQMTPPSQPESTPSGPDRPLAGAMEGLSWSVLLARWTELAQASAALPEDAEGGRWKQAVAPVIGLQAIAFALADLGRVRPDDRPLALERAEAGLRAHAAELHSIWTGEPLPDSVAEVIADARGALLLAASAGEEWRVSTDDFVAPDPTPLATTMLDAGFAGDLWAATPGTRLARRAPAAFARPGADIAWPGCERPRWSAHRQIYRQVDEAAGRVTRDVVMPVEAGLPPGRPLLVQVIEQGELVFTFDDDRRRAWEDAQRRAGALDQPPPLSDGGDTAGPSDSSG